MSSIGGESALTSQIINNKEGNCSSFKKMTLHSELSVYCHYFMGAAEFLDGRKLWRSHLTLVFVRGWLFICPVLCTKGFRVLVCVVIKEHILLYRVMSVLMQTQDKFMHSQVTDAMDSDGFTAVTVKIMRYY